MNNNFLKFKTKYIMAAILKSVIFGISCGLLAAGAVMLPLKLTAVNLHFGFYILIGIGVAVLFGGAFFGCLYKFGLSDKQIAKKLDKDYELNERVQTVVEYGNDQSDIISLLKEDTENRLGNLPKRKFNFLRALSAIWFYAVIAVLSLALFIGAVCIPVRSKPTPEKPPVIEPPDEDPAFDYGLELQSQLYDLMRDVMNSNLQDDEKDAILNVLEDLDKRVLPTIEKKSQLDIAIITAVYAVDGIISNANTFRKVSEALNEVDEHLSKAVTEGVVLYKAFSYNLIDLDMVKGLYSRVNSNIDEALQSYFTESYEAHKFTEEVEDGVIGTVVNGEVVLEYKNSLNAALAALSGSGMDVEDSLYSALANFQKGIEVVYNRFLEGGWSANTLNEGQEKSLKLAYDPDFKSNATDAMLLQSYNCIMDVYVRQKLAAIFGVSISEIGGVYDDLTSEWNKTNEDGPGNGDPNHGGFGDGQDLYGSKDLIYDTESGKQVEYGKVYNEYYSKVDDRIRSGELSQDLVDFIKEYFNILLNGTKDKESEEK